MGWWSSGVMEEWSDGGMERKNKNRVYQQLRVWQDTNPIAFTPATTPVTPSPTLQHSVTPSLHYSITPLLHHSTTPSLHYSNTPLFQHSTTPLLPHSTAVLTLASLILKLLTQAVGQQVKEHWIILSDANQISLVFRPFAQASPWIAPSPDFSLNQIRQSGNRNPGAKNFPNLGSRDKRLIPFVSCKLDNEITARLLGVHREFKLRDFESLLR
jgi:hypothetical protein